MSLIIDAGFFKINAQGFNSFNQRITESEFSSAFKPYFDLTSNLKSLIHPFAHTTRLIRESGRLLYGASLLLAGACTFNKEIVANAFVGCCYTMLNMASNVLTCAISILSLATRLVASVANLGYVSTNRNVQNAIAGDNLRWNSNINDPITMSSKIEDNVNHNFSLVI